MPRVPPSPECRLVFRSADPAAGPEVLRGIAGEVRDWKRVLELAEHEAAASTLWRGIGAATAVPPPVADHLRKSAMVTDFRMQLLAQRAADAVRALTEANVPVLLLKGAAVGASSDPTFRSRPMTDVDLMVRRPDASRARQAVLAAGWPETTDPVLLELLRHAHHLPPFVEPSIPGVRLEVHVALLPSDHSFALEEDEVWQRARQAPAPFDGALLPSREHLLWHTCVHFAWEHQFQFGMWRSARSVGALLGQPGFDWEGFILLARRSRAASACYWTLRLSEWLAGIPVPAHALAALTPPTPRLVLDALERSFIAVIAPGESPQSPSAQLSRFLWRAALRPRWSGYPSVGRIDPERRWERARGTLSTETRGARVTRHLAGLGAWWRFFRQTLL